MRSTPTPWKDFNRWRLPGYARIEVSPKENMTLNHMAALFGAMIVLAAVPSVSVLAVAARSASSGFIHGALAAMGIVVGDIFLILLAIFGLVLLVEALGDLFFLVQYIGAAYLIGFGVSLWRSRTPDVARKGVGNASLRSSFMTGLLITLGDQKAIWFYWGFFPAFVDLAALSIIDIGAVVVIAIMAVGGVKLGYAYAADRVSFLLGSSLGTAVNVCAAGVLVAAGAFLAASGLVG